MNRRTSLRAMLAAALCLAVFAVAAAQSNTTIHLPLVAVPLPTNTPTATAIPSPTATVVPQPLNLVVRSARLIDRRDQRRLVGEVQNNGSSPVYSPQVRVRFFTAENQPAGVREESTLLFRINPGQVAPFDILAPGPLFGNVRFEISLSAQTTTNVDYVTPTLVSQQQQNTSSVFGVQVVGELRNQSDQRVEGARAVVTFYNEQNEVVAVAVGQTFKFVLAPNEAGTFEASTLDPALSFSRYIVQTEAQIVR